VLSQILLEKKNQINHKKFKMVDLSPGFSLMASPLECPLAEIKSEN
jgi:hypothetical protein